MKQLIILFAASFFFASCSKDDSNNSQPTNSSVSSTLISNNWRITYFFDDQDETSSFTGYLFSFLATGAVTASNNGTTVSGTWAPGNDDSNVKLILFFSGPSSFSELSEDWRVLEQTSTRIKLEHVSGGNGGTDFLTFERI